MGHVNARGNPLYVSTFELRACDVDVGNRWRPSAIFVATQEFGEDHSVLLDCSHQDLAEKGVFFILLRQKIEVLRYPRCAETLRGETWAGKIQRTIFPRFYRFYDAQGELCVTGSTLWALCSARDRRIVRPADVGVSLPDPPYENLEEPGKLRFPDGPSREMLHAVRYSDMDYNGHVNNTRYVDWCCDLFPVSSFAHRSLAHFQINYVSEMRDEAQVRLELLERDAGFSVRGSGAADGSVIFQAAGSWMETG